MSITERTANDSLRQGETERESGFLFRTYFPQRVLTNGEIASWNVRTRSGRLLSAEDIFHQVGIKTRTVANEVETALSMGIAAASPIVDQVGRGIDAVIFSSSYPTGEHNSTEIARTFHLEADDVVDIYAACSGSALGLTFIKDRESRLFGKRILLVTSEKYSPTLPDLAKGEEDLLAQSQTIFSDGAVALSFMYGRDIIILGYKNYDRSSFPEGSEFSICMPTNYDLIRHPHYPENFPPIPQPENGKFFMDGPKVYRTLQKYHPQQILEAIESVGLSLDQVALVIPHQASSPMLNTVVEHLPEELRDKVFYDLEEGNYSSASIPKAFMRALREERVKPGDIVVFDGFGAGLYASIVVTQIGEKAQVKELTQAA